MNFQDFKEKYEKIPVDHYPNAVNKNPLVSVCIQTYNHADYVEECLEGILMQETTFPIEILLGEDDSNDGTRDICVEYAKKYPEKIRLFLHHRENNIKVGGRPSGRFNFLYNLFSARGKYIALCEGDDYWIDPLKLQKQVSFLEKNEDVVMCFTNAEIDYYIPGEKNRLYLSSKESKYLKPPDVISSAVPTMTRVFRNLKIKYDFKTISGDYMQQLELSKFGSFYLLNEATAVYRKHDQGISKTTNWLKWNLNTAEYLRDFKKRCLKSQVPNVEMKIAELKILAAFSAYVEKKYLQTSSLIMQVVFSKKIYKRKTLGLIKLFLFEVVIKNNQKVLDRF